MVRVRVWKKGEVAKVVARRWPSGPAFPMPSECGADWGPGFSCDWWKVKARVRLNWRRCLPCATGHDISSFGAACIIAIAARNFRSQHADAYNAIQVEEELCAEDFPNDADLTCLAKRTTDVCPHYITPTTTTATAPTPSTHPSPDQNPPNCRHSGQQLFSRLCSSHSTRYILLTCIQTLLATCYILLSAPAGVGSRNLDSLLLLSPET